MSDKRYPLSWPIGWPRTRYRQPAKFGTRGEGRGFQQASIAVAIQRLQRELDNLRASQVILSTNVELRLDGLPRSDRATPMDPGAAVYFKLKGHDIALACDKWSRVADNIIALAKHIEAMRGMDRWGVGSVEQAFRGYEALPAPSAQRSWRAVLGYTSDDTVKVDEVDRRYRLCAKDLHPDLENGDAAKMAELNAARDAARRELA